MANPHFLHMAETIAEMRTARDVIFGPEWFSDPAWDMLIELYIAEARGASTQLQVMTAAARVSRTTGYRVACRLADANLIDRRPHEVRLGGVNLHFTQAGREKIEKLLQLAIEIGERHMKADFD